VNVVYASDQRFSSFVILVILSFGVRKGKDSNLLTENCFISQVPLFVIHIDSQHNFNLAPQNLITLDFIDVFLFSDISLNTISLQRRILFRDISSEIFSLQRILFRHIFSLETYSLKRNI
jgi:hypothetical protein